MLHAFWVIISSTLWPYSKPLAVARHLDDKWLVVKWQTARGNLICHSNGIHFVVARMLPLRACNLNSTHRLTSALPSLLIPRSICAERLLAPRYWLRFLFSRRHNSKCTQLKRKYKMRRTHRRVGNYCRGCQVLYVVAVRHNICYRSVKIHYQVSHSLFHYSHRPIIWSPTCQLVSRLY